MFWSNIGFNYIPQEGDKSANIIMIVWSAHAQYHSPSYVAVPPNTWMPFLRVGLSKPKIPRVSVKMPPRRKQSLSQKAKEQGTKSRRGRPPTKLTRKSVNDEADMGDFEDPEESHDHVTQKKTTRRR